jgi:hypothetical protein
MENNETLIYTTYNPKEIVEKPIKPFESTRMKLKRPPKFHTVPAKPLNI